MGDRDSLKRFKMASKGLSDGKGKRIWTRVKSGKQGERWNIERIVYVHKAK